MNEAELPEGRGFGVEDLPPLYRQMAERALAVAGLDWDPATEWDRFVGAAWQELSAALGLDGRPGWPEGLPLPNEVDVDRPASWFEDELRP